jgi:hypothetical protein
MEVGLVRRIDIDHEMQQSYLDYAMSVIVARAAGRPRRFDRLCAATALDPQRQATLAELRSTTNPLQLRNEVHALLDRLSRLPSARAGRPQDVRRTLFQHTHETASVTLSIEGSFTAR